jgi:uncharacterized repeat protein (TIGR01451 family)/LPXTG-motif cell wall-anchored protein
LSVLSRHAPARRTVLSALGAGSLIVAALIGSVPAQADPGDPGVPSTPSVVYDENFENGLADTDSQALTDYAGATGTAYTGSPYWTETTMCNGILISANAPDALGCTLSSATQLRRMADVLAQVNGGTADGFNHAVSAYTNAPDPSHPLAANDIEFETETPITLSGGSRFLTFSVDAASLNCGAGAAELSFFLDDGTDVLSATNTPIDVCTNLGASDYSVDGVTFRAGRFVSDSSVLFSGSSLGIVMRNGYGSATGNDHAFDNIRVLDATPQLDKSFETNDDPWITGEPADLTFTVTNTSELAEKTGWSFTDELPSGLEVAGTASTSCAAADITADDGDDTVTIANGSIASDVASCTVTVPVTADAAGSFTNGPDNVTTTGLKAPGSSTITFEDPDPELTLQKTANLDDTNDNGLADIGEHVSFTFDVENTGNVDIDDVTINDDLLESAGVDITPETQDVARGETESFTSEPYLITQDDIDQGGVSNTATAGGTYGGDPVESDEDSTDTPGLERHPELTIVKQATLADANGNDLADKGEMIVYSFLVTNTGNVTVLNVSVSDGKVTGLDPDMVAALGPNESVMFTADPYVVTADDIADGSVDNTAVALGDTVDDQGVESDPDSVSTDAVEPPDQAGLLPDTGGPFVGAGVLGAVLLAAGTAILLRRRRRTV